MLPKIGVAGAPAGPKGQFNTAYVRDGLAIMNTGNQKRMDLSKDLMRHLYSKDVYRKWMQLAFPSPAVAGMEDHGDLEEPAAQGLPGRREDRHPAGAPGPADPRRTPSSTPVAPLISAAARMAVEGWSPEQALDELAKVAEDVFSKYK